MSEKSPKYEAGPESAFRRLRDKYGGDVRQAINRAIRAECAGGAIALERLTTWYQICQRKGWAAPGAEEPIHVTAYRHILEIVDAMEADVRRRHELPEAPSRKDLERFGVAGEGSNDAPS